MTGEVIDNTMKPPGLITYSKTAIIIIIIIIIIQVYVSKQGYLNEHILQHRTDKCVFWHVVAAKSQKWPVYEKGFL